MNWTPHFSAVFFTKPRKTQIPLFNPRERSFHLRRRVNKSKESLLFWFGKMKFLRIQIIVKKAFTTNQAIELILSITMIERSIKVSRSGDFPVSFSESIDCMT